MLWNCCSSFYNKFFLEAYGIHLPLLSIKSQHPTILLNDFSFIGLLFAGAGTLIFSFYEIFFIPEYLNKLEIGSQLRNKAKTIFTLYLLYGEL